MDSEVVIWEQAAGPLWCSCIGLISLARQAMKKGKKGQLMLLELSRKALTVQ